MHFSVHPCIGNSVRGWEVLTADGGFTALNTPALELDASVVFKYSTSRVLDGCQGTEDSLMPLVGQTCLSINECNVNSLPASSNVPLLHCTMPLSTSFTGGRLSHSISEMCMRAKGDHGYTAWASASHTFPHPHFRKGTPAFLGPVETGRRHEDFARLLHRSCDSELSQVVIPPDHNRGLIEASRARFNMRPATAVHRFLFSCICHAVCQCMAALYKVHNCTCSSYSHRPPTFAPAGSWSGPTDRSTFPLHQQLCA